MAVTSLDGKLTRGDDPDIYKWTSKEDSAFFFSKIRKSRLVVMGSKTYEAAKPVLKLIKGRTTLVITKNPQKYQSEFVKDYLEFTSDTPSQIVQKYSRLGHKEMLLVGGATIHSLFLQAKLIDELHLTIEPLIFGVGKNLVDRPVDINLTLIGMTKLNKKGTLHLKYRVNYE